MELLGNTSRRRFLKAGSLLSLGAAFGHGTMGEAFADSQSAVTPRQFVSVQEPAGSHLAKMQFARFM